MDGTICAIGTVINQDPEHGGLVVTFRSGQIPALPVKMLYQGYADPLRVRQQALPQKGTSGLVVFPGGDPRNGLWLGSYYPNLQDAITSDPGDPTVDYHAHWSGFWSMVNASGFTPVQWPDGSYFMAGSGTTLPETYRHIVDENQQQQRQVFAFSDRVPNPPDPFYFFFQQAGSGLTWTLDASGNHSLVGGPSGSFTLDYASGTTFAVDVSGNATWTGKQGATLTIKFGGSTITSDGSGNVTIDVGSGKNLNITDGGGASDGLALVSLLIDWLNNHVHGGVMSGGSTTTPPTSPATAGEIESAIIKIQQ